jgi:hypothetical protein
LLEGRHIALSRLLSQCVIRFRLRLDFGCGHVFVLGKLRRFHPQRLFATIITSPHVSKERQPFPQHFPDGLLRGLGRPQRGCDAAL